MALDAEVYCSVGVYCSVDVAHLCLVERFHFLNGFLGLSFEPSVVQVLVQVVDGPITSDRDTSTKISPEFSSVLQQRVSWIVSLVSLSGNTNSGLGK